MNCQTRAEMATSSTTLPWSPYARLKVGSASASQGMFRLLCLAAAQRELFGAGPTWEGDLENCCSDTTVYVFADNLPQFQPHLLGLNDDGSYSGTFVSVSGGLGHRTESVVGVQ